MVLDIAITILLNLKKIVSETIVWRNGYMSKTEMGHLRRSASNYNIPGRLMNAKCCETVLVSKFKKIASSVQKDDREVGKNFVPVAQAQLPTKRLSTP